VVVEFCWRSCGGGSVHGGACVRPGGSAGQGQRRRRRLGGRVRLQGQGVGEAGRGAAALQRGA
jgi:hypothetical protein